MRYTDSPVLILATAFICLSSARISAQQTPAVVGSTVSGRVVCIDTNAPARFAKVLLKSIEPGRFGDDFTKRLQDTMKQSAAKSGQPAPKAPTEEQKRAQVAASRNINRAMDMLNSSTVGLNGEYSFAGVKPGTYYVHVMFAGYIDPLAQVSDDDLASTNPAVRARIAAKVPTVTLTGTDSAHVDLRLERGAAVSGRVLFDDGSPAVGWTVSAVDPKSPEDANVAVTAMMNQALTLSGAPPVAKTDDLGRYRISGLPGGNYALRASLDASPIGISAANISDGGSNLSIIVYSGNTFARADAKSFSIAAGEDHSGGDLTVPASKLHSIIGHVYAKSDDHTVNVGDVTLTSKSNDALHLKAAVRDDGSFHYNYLPRGAYTITVEGAADSRTAGSTSILGMSIPKQDILQKYGTDTTEVMLSDADVDSVRLTVAQTDWMPPTKKPGASEADPGAALGDALGTLFSTDPDDSKEKPKP